MTFSTVAYVYNPKNLTQGQTYHIDKVNKKKKQQIKRSPLGQRDTTSMVNLRKNRFGQTSITTGLARNSSVAKIM